MIIFGKMEVGEDINRVFSGLLGEKSNKWVEDRKRDEEVNADGKNDNMF